MIFYWTYLNKPKQEILTISVKYLRKPKRFPHHSSPQAPGNKHWCQRRYRPRQKSYNISSLLTIGSVLHIFSICILFFKFLHSAYFVFCTISIISNKYITKNRSVSKKVDHLFHKHHFIQSSVWLKHHKKWNFQRAANCYLCYLRGVNHKHLSADVGFWISLSNSKSYISAKRC